MRRFPKVSAALWGATSLGILALIALPQPKDAAQVTAEPVAVAAASSTPDYSAFSAPLPKLTAVDLDARKLSPLATSTQQASSPVQKWFTWTAAAGPDRLTSASWVGDTKPTSKMWVAVAANVRSGPSVKAPRLSTLPAAQHVFVAEAQGNWSRVLLPDGSAGWVASSLLSKGRAVAPAPVKPPAKADTRIAQKAADQQRGVKASARLAGDAVLRASPNRSAPRSHQVAEGEMVTVIERRDGWARVALENGTTGWVRVR